MSILKKLFPGQDERYIKTLTPVLEQVNGFESEVSKLSQEEMRAKYKVLRDRAIVGEELDALLPETFALVREASKRTLGERHYDVQILGGMILSGRKIAEMRTGEGKTLVATLPAVLYALPAKGVHVITVNDYLARRDGVWMGQIYAYLGLTVAVLNHNTSYIYDPNHDGKPEADPAKAEAQVEGDALDTKRDETGSFKVEYAFLRSVTRREAYLADITYGTNSEFGFDYLRDNLEYRQEALRQRDFAFAIVDEIDSILIDEARTPLIISAPARDSEKLYTTFAGIAAKLIEDTDYTKDEKHHSIALTDAGITKAETLLGVQNIYSEKGIKYVHHLETAVRAKALFHKDKEYVVRDNQVIIVDEFTGRMQPGRRWSEGLHQAVEAKEGVKIQQESRTYASITYQNYFRLYPHLSGMTGTAKTSSEEFYKVYGLDVVPVPTHRPVARIDRDDLIFQTEKGKFKAIARKVKELHTKGQPVLVGTASIEKNEVLGEYLKTEGIPHVILNAKNHEREGEIIAQAGKKGAVTIATNMAGRGVDIKLGGNPSTKETYEDIKSLGGLFVLGTERHEARRIDNQLRGRSGRQGDPGETQFYVSLEDSLMRIFASDMLKNMMGRFGIAEDEPLQNKIVSRSLETAQTRIEGFNFDSRKHVLEFDDVLNVQRKSIYSKRRAVLTGDNAVLDAKLQEIGLGDEAFLKVVEDKKVALKDAFYQVVRAIMLQVMDMHWVEHLETMDYTRSSVNLRAYGQRDPLVEYKKEGLRLFRGLEDSVYAEIKRIVATISTEAAKMNTDLKEVKEGAESITKTTDTTVKNEYDGVGRNDPCPCGSGKKFKKCHGQ